MSRDELIAAVSRVLAAQAAEAELDELIGRLEESVPHPRITDLMFSSEPALTPEEIVDEALRYQPIPAGPGGAGRASDEPKR